ncbi:hypothetical protein HMPREF0044_0373 [Gleimia coleocanis DSM 15436]|uniref:DUF11 domain-containing protein n=1 Tax=Gleimia coleocanis DSM 15436 TaxID=525245 RepID=C0VYY3_9ACTO|nr:DUF11 domain-containing protein [Gleimia coleocanis]EEH64636.1 hypothetical protein HMPREF0044_0373 [Gleimia coleocanis DSM 15436]
MTAELPAGITDVDNATNTVDQQIALRRPDSSILSVTKVQDKETVASGETRTYTVTYRNTGDKAYTVDLTDAYYGVAASRKDVVRPGTYSVSCGANTVGVECPAEFDGSEKQIKKVIIHF